MGGGRRKAKLLNLEITLHKFSMEPKNDGFQKESPIPGCHFQVNHVKLWEGIIFQTGGLDRHPFVDERLQILGCS